MRCTTWSPFQSPEAKAIYSNLTIHEYQELQKLTNGFAIRNGLICGVCALAFQQPYIILKVISLTLLILHYFNQTSLIDELKQLLCSTEWAKAQGYTPNKLKLYSFPFSLKKVKRYELEILVAVSINSR